MVSLCSLSPAPVVTPALQSLRTTVGNSEKAQAGDPGTPLPGWVTAGMLLILSDAFAGVATMKWVWFIRTSGWLHTSEGVTSSYSLRCDRVELRLH